jgi:putative ABC transport system substrate-binding protein
MTQLALASRRSFTRYLGSALGSLLVVARVSAQTSIGLHRIGILSDFDEPAPSTPQARLSRPFGAALNELGYAEGRNIAFVVRYGGKGEPERLRTMAGDLVAAKVDVIVVAGGDVAIRAAQDATATTPIVMMYGRDPVGTGFAASLARPGGNITGVTIDVGPEENSKRMQLLKEAVPSMKTLVFIAEAAWGDFGDRDPYVVALRTSARSMGVVVTNVIVLKGAADVAAALDTVRRARPHALMLATGPALNAHSATVHEFLRVERLPTLVMARSWIERGALLSYGPYAVSLQRQAAEYVARILKGGHPALMPISRPRKQELVLNGRTATTLGLTFPASLILNADEVIQ